MTAQPRYRRPLNNDQLDVLYLLYKFRFLTSDLLASYFGKASGIYVYKRLQVLTEQGFIGKRFDSSYRLRGMPAAYYLKPKGLTKLNENRTTLGKEHLLGGWLYKETRVSQQFVEYCCGMFETYLLLREQLGEDLRFFTKTQLKGKYEYFEEFTPAGYASIRYSGKDHDYFIEYIQAAKPVVAAVVTVRQYVAFSESGDWESSIGEDLPPVLLICKSDKIRKKLITELEPILSNADDNLRVYVSVTLDLKEWQDITEHSEIRYPILSI